MLKKSNISFIDLKIKKLLLMALNDLGYKKPSPIQIKCIPLLLSGKDVLGMAQTGSGKTAAFCIPLLQNINNLSFFPQILVLTPTRELAIQVGEAFFSFAKYIPGIKISTLYGGQRYDIQLRILRKGPQVVVGTPGRLLDHLKRKTLNLSKINKLVLDEADEMLRMGFIEDVEKILSKLPFNRQTSLFSATMPDIIRKLSKRFMKNPKEVSIKSNISNKPNISQYYWYVYGVHKNEGLIRFLESEDFDAVIIFVKTKNSTLEVSRSLEKSGYNCAALNGDMNQLLRERTLNRLRNGNLDILIATDIAARGLDVERISLVINYDIPLDVESYIHRIGRTGRAGRSGKALLFVENREIRLLRNIERITKSNIIKVNLPTAELLNTKRLNRFSIKIKKELNNINFIEYKKQLKKLQLILDNIDIEKIAVILLKIASYERPLILDYNPIIKNKSYTLMNNYKKNINKKNIKNSINRNMKLFRINIGKSDGIEVRHIINAIVNEYNINNNNIGNIKIYYNYSIIELLEKISYKIINKLNKIKIMNKFIYFKYINNNIINKKYKNKQNIYFKNKKKY